MLDTMFFYMFALLAVAGAILTITMRNAVNCAIALIASLAGVAGLYLLQRAEFLFAVQLVLYIGGIMVLFLFVIMLVNLDSAAKERQFHRHWITGAVAAILAGAVSLWLLSRGTPTLKAGAPQTLPAANGNIEQLADLLFREYLVPFELASVLLLLAIVGSVLMAKKRTN
ncbi:MAG TPA: NADH-quinone oxidoreductase subunit J [Bryobacteraceae bacterium]|nr:NADH-quinone oxidoreductase subunit J [Bryobacteraceae bacterium]HPT25441.1 NADH-quinone oxidoreductase subunit J [Bryobacteraceae bacterium]